MGTTTPRLASFLGQPDAAGFIREHGCTPYCTTCADWHFPGEQHSNTMTYQREAG